MAFDKQSHLFTASLVTWFFSCSVQHHVGATQPVHDPNVSFSFQHYTAGSGALYRSQGGNSGYDDSVRVVHVDHKDHVWVGTVTGVTTYDGAKWRTHSFVSKRSSGVAQLVLDLFDINESGPGFITDGVDGSVWLAGIGGVWQYRDAEYSTVDSETCSRLGIVVDRKGDVFVLEKYRVQRYSGKAWTTVLDPFGKRTNTKSDGFLGICLDREGVVWIGATRHDISEGGVIHDGPRWVVPKAPRVPLFSCDGRVWQAHGTKDGLAVQWCQPRLDAFKGIRLHTSEGVYIHQSGVWLRNNQPREFYSGKRWALRETDKGRPQLVYSENSRDIIVKPVERKSRTEFDVAAENPALLSVAEDKNEDAVWLGTWHGLYRIWRNRPPLNDVAR